MHHPLVDVITTLAEARRVLREGSATDPRPWVDEVSDSVDAALERIDEAIQLAVDAALRSGVPRMAIEAAGGTAIIPDPFG